MKTVFLTSSLLDSFGGTLLGGITGNRAGVCILSHYRTHQLTQLRTHGCPIDRVITHHGVCELGPQIGGTRRIGPTLNILPVIAHTPFGTGRASLLD